MGVALHYQESSLWSRFIKAIHGVRGVLDINNSLSRRSPWLDIIRELQLLELKGIDCLALVRKKVGNGDDTLFWNDLWLGDEVLKVQYPRLYALKTYKDVCVF